MSENPEDIDTSVPLTPKRAWQLNVEDGHKQSVIGDAYDKHRNTVSKLKTQYEEMQEEAENAAADAVDSLDISEHISDEEPDENPYDMVACPACGKDMEKPESAGQHRCPHCNSSLRFTEDEV